MMQIHPSTSMKTKEFSTNPYFSFINEIKSNNETHNIIYEIFGGMFTRTFSCLNCKEQVSSRPELFLNLNLNFPLNIYFRSKEQTHILQKLVFYSSKTSDFKENDIKEFISEKFPNVNKDSLKFHLYSEFFNENDENKEYSESSNSYSYKSNEFNSATSYNFPKKIKKSSEGNMIFVNELNEQELKDLQANDDVLYLILQETSIGKYQIFTYIVGNRHTTSRTINLEVYSRIQQKELSIIKEEFEEKYINNGSIIDENKAPFVLMSFGEQASTTHILEKEVYKKRIYQYIDEEFDLDQGNQLRIKKILIKIAPEQSFNFPKISKQIKIMDFIELLFHSEKIEEKKCEKCSNALTKNTKIQIAPNILILVIGRFYHDTNSGQLTKNNTPINIDENLSFEVECPNLMFNLEQINFKEKCVPKKVEYELIGIINHYGKDLYQGHYISYCWDFLRRQWFKCDDHEVDPEQIGIICKENNEVYIIFYRKKTT